MKQFLKFEDAKCIDILLNEDVLAFPTETVYGLGVIYDSKKAFDNLVSLKRRSPDKPFTVMISSLSDIDKFAYIDEKIKRVIDKYFPGEITLLLKAKDNYPWVTLGSKIIGIRMSAAKDVCDLISRVNKPLLVTSANISGEESLYNAEDVEKVFKDEIKGIVKSNNNNSSNIPSTIVLISDDNIKLIRQGKLSFEEIKSVWEGNI